MHQPYSNMFDLMLHEGKVTLPRLVSIKDKRGPFAQLSSHVHTIIGWFI